jgi:MFS family permease
MHSTENRPSSAASDEEAASGHVTASGSLVETETKPVPAPPEDGESDIVSFADMSNTEKKWLVGISLAVVGAQWCLMGLMPGFFPTSTYGARITNVQQGIVFSSFYIGSSAASPFAVPVMNQVGAKKTVTYGLASMAVFIAGFGLVPEVMGRLGLGACTPAGTPTPAPPAGDDCTPTSLTAAFTLLGVLFGIGSTLAEGAVYALLATCFPDEMGSIMSRLEGAIGVGSLVGPFVGGAVFEAAAPLGPRAQFVAPFAALAAVPLLLTVLAHSRFPDVAVGAEEADDAGGAAPATLRELLHFDVVLTLLVVLANSAVYASLQTTVAFRMSYPPTQLGPFLVGSLFMLQGVFYMGSTLPLGALVDRVVGRRAPLMQLQALGMLLYFLGFSMLAPLYLRLPPAAGGLAFALDLAPAFNSTGWVVVAQMVLGLGCALTVIPSLPILFVGLPEASAGKLTGWWLAAVGAGYALGPILGSAMMGVTGGALSRVLCSEAVQLAELSRPGCGSSSGGGGGTVECLVLV